MKGKSRSWWICFWLAVIAIILFAGVILFAAYIYKFDPLSTFTQLFNTDAEVIWAALGVVVTGCIGVMTLQINKSLREVQDRQASIQEKQAEIASRQDQLYSEPHIMLESIKVKKVDAELTADKRQIKGIKDFNYPYYENREEEVNFSQISMIEIVLKNTSEAFARLRFKEAIIASGVKDEQGIASFNESSFGYPATQVMIAKGESATIGLVIGTSRIPDLKHSKITISTYLDSNFRETFIDTQSYQITGVCEGAVRFMPWDMSKNEFRKIEKEKKEEL